MAKILAVDDNVNNLNLVRFLLRHQKHEVDEAVNGAEAVALALQNDYAVILMDIQMPIMDGITAAKKIKAVKPGQKIVAVSARVFADQIEEIKSSGFDGFIEKPFDPSYFLDVVSSTIS